MTRDDFNVYFKRYLCTSCDNDSWCPKKNIPGDGSCFKQRVKHPYHPAKYSGILLPLFARLLHGCKYVLDPFAGTGKIASIKQHGFTGRVVCNDLEPEWKDPSFPVDEWHLGDAEHLSWCNDATFDAICTSPTYGNRMADHHDARDASKRRTYKHCLGRDLTDGNTGMMQWGDEYREKHVLVYKELHRVLMPGGLFVLNVSNHVRDGIEVDVVGWHERTMLATGFSLQSMFNVPTPRMKYGENREARVPGEVVLVFIKEGKENEVVMTCDVCKKPCTVFTVPFESKIVCSSCFDRKMESYYKEHGIVPVGIADLKEIFSRKKKVKTLF